MRYVLYFRSKMRADDQALLKYNNDMLSSEESSINSDFFLFFQSQSHWLDLIKVLYKEWLSRF